MPKMLAGSLALLLLLTGTWAQAAEPAAATEDDDGDLVVLSVTPRDPLVKPVISSLPVADGQHARLTVDGTKSAPQPTATAATRPQPAEKPSLAIASLH
jgi:hypothetical protein